MEKTEIYKNLVYSLKLQFKEKEKEKVNIESGIYNRNFPNIYELQKVTTENCKYKYDLINQLTIFLLYGDRFSTTLNCDIFRDYINNFILGKHFDKKNIIISDLVIHFAIICIITSEQESVFCNKVDDMVDLEEEKQQQYSIIAPKYNNKFHKLIENMVNDGVITGEKLLNIVIKYQKYVKVHSLLSFALKSTKLSELYMDNLIKEYNGNLDILNHFASWNIIVTKEQYYKLIENGCMSDPNLMEKYNIPFNSEYVLATVKSGIYPIPGIPPNNKIILTENEKEKLLEYIFKKSFPKKELNNMKKQFSLTYNDECMLDFCKNDGSLATYKYLISLGLKPTIECLYYLIPKHCSHRNVKNILDDAL